MEIQYQLGPNTMKSRTMLSFFPRLATLLAILACQEAQSFTRPNVLLIVADDMKPVMRCYGDSIAVTPFLDRLAAEGVLFNNHHCQQALSGPSRVSMFSGLRPDNTRVWNDVSWMRENAPALLTIPQYFKQHGYTTAGTGMIFEPGNVESPAGMDNPSWEIPFRHIEQNPDGEFGFLEEGLIKKIRRLKDQAAQQGITDEKEIRTFIGGLPSAEGSQDVPDEAYDDGKITHSAMELIDSLARNGKPFFLAVGFKKPALPFAAPKRYWNQYSPSMFNRPSGGTIPERAPKYAWKDTWELQSNHFSDIPQEGPLPPEVEKKLLHGYYACVSYVDAQVGKLLGKLDDLGIRQNTIVVFWGDSGLHLGDHGVWGKQSTYEQATRTPLIISAPEINPGTTATPVESVDIFPTLCELSGLPPSSRLDGKSLMPILEGYQKDVKPAAITQLPAETDGKPVMGYSYRDARYRYTAWMQKNYPAGDTNGVLIAEELYDYESAPAEPKNLADDAGYANVLTSMRKVAGVPPAIQNTMEEVSFQTAAKASSPAAQTTWKKPDRTIPYREDMNSGISLHVFLPKGWSPDDRRSAAVLFHGGGWYTGAAKGFYHYAHYFAEAGMVAIAVDYRTINGHQVTPKESLEDTAAALRRIREMAAELGIASNRIAAIGASSGAHMAMACAIMPPLQKDPACRPDALVLLAPILEPSGHPAFQKNILTSREDFDLVQYLQAGMPPVMILAGGLDNNFDPKVFKQVNLLQKQMQNHCKIAVYDTGDEFFYFKRDQKNTETAFHDVINRMTSFFQDIQFWEPDKKGDGP